MRRELTELRNAVKALQPKTIAYIPPHTTVGDNATIAPTVSFTSSQERPITVGARTKIYRNTEINGPVSIGEGCLINRDGYIRPGTTIGDRVFVGPYVRLVTDGHEIGASQQRAGANTAPPITIGDGTWIGAGATVLGGVTIGAGCMVAAGAVVTKDVPDNTLVGGIPAKVIRSLS